MDYGGQEKSDKDQVRCSVWKRKIREARRERGRLVWHVPVCKAGVGFICVLYALFQTVSDVYFANPTHPHPSWKAQ